MRKVILFGIVLVMFIGCSKKSDNFVVRESNGITFYNNTEVPNDPTAKLDFKKAFTIDTDALADSTALLKHPYIVLEDRNKNIYILDVGAMNVKKFDKRGAFIKNIGRSGQGPGEFNSPSLMYIDNDTLKIYSVSSFKISKFDLDGEFYYDKIIDRIQPQWLEISPSGKTVTSFVFRPNQGEDREIANLDLSVIDLKSMTIKNIIQTNSMIQEDLFSGKKGMSDFLYPFSVDDKFVYITELNDYQYKVTAFDHEGNKKMEIGKSFKKIRFEKEEKNEYSALMDKYKGFSRGKPVGNYKEAINMIHTDKYGRLLVVPNIDRNIDSDGVYIDIFKDGIFLNRVEYGIIDKDTIGLLWMLRGQVRFSGTRMYYINKDDNTVDVYDY
ncbi:MAG: 6-bladed beta-propeller [Candidatus Delongbacteria bacterium]|jgi:hypothetical protein|nr:6-bladed beta-propeller [Candidatus Delongbacteria bacterium]